MVKGRRDYENLLPTTIGIHTNTLKKSSPIFENIKKKASQRGFPYGVCQNWTLTAMIIYWLEFIAAPYPINPYLLSIVIFVISLTLSILLTIMVRKLGLGVIIGETSK